MNSPDDFSTLLDLAIADHTGGDLEAAERKYRQLLVLSPDDPDALNLLGLLVQDRGHFTESFELLSRALEIDPEFPEALINLARLQRALGNSAEAAVTARKALTLDPELAEAYLQLGNALLDLKHADEAAEAFEQGAARGGNVQSFRVGLGRAELERGHPQQATVIFEELLKSDSRHVDALIGAGVARARNGDLAAALAYHKEALTISPDRADAHAALAFTHRYRLDAEASAAACRNALAIDDRRVDLWVLLGSNLASLGDFPEAETCLRRALALNPQSGEAWRDLSLIGHAANQDDIARLNVVLANSSAHKIERVAAGFSLGRLLDKAEMTDSAFAAYRVANAMARESAAQTGEIFSTDALRHQIDWTMRTFHKSLFESLSGIGHPSDCPVFIVGMPRSGTTLVEQIAASHPGVYGAGERTDMQTIVSELSGEGLLSPSKWDAKAAGVAAAKHIEMLGTLAGGRARFIDKMPDNIFLLGFIAVLFPNARIVFCWRDYRDTCLSAFFQQFGDAVPWTFDLADCADRAREVDRLANHWKRVLPLQMMDLSYEDLIADSEGQSRRLIDFLDLPWDPKCLSSHETTRPIMTASVWQVRQPVYNVAVGRWRRYHRHLAPLLLGLIGLTHDPEPDDWDVMLSDGDQALRAGAKHQFYGRLPEAEQIYRAYLDQKPTDAQALHLLGMLTLQKGEAANAIELLEASIRVNPDSAPAFIELARAYRQQDKASDAWNAAKRALAIAPSSAEGKAEMALALLMTHRVEEARQMAEDASRAASDAVQPLYALATILDSQQKYKESEPVWRKAISISPAASELLRGLVESMLKQNRYQDAIDFQRSVVEQFPDAPLPLYQLAWLHFRAQDIAAVMEICRSALSTYPKSHEFWLLLANALLVRGKFSEAADAYRHALLLEPNSGDAYFGLVQCGETQQADNILDRAGALKARSDMSPEKRIAAAFALAAQHDKHGDYDSAFAAYVEANQLAHAHRLKKDVKGRLEDLRKFVDWTIETFQPGTFGLGQKLGNPSELPAFVVGMPRSGTSLIEQIAASHPKIFGEGEREDLTAILTMDDISYAAYPPEALDPRAVKVQTDGLLRTLRMRGGDAERVINKMPDNILWLGYIFLLFPNARVIVTERDLRDVCLSCYFQNFFDARLVWTDTLEDCAFRARQISRLIAHWNRVLPERFLTMNYENLVGDLETESRRLIDFLGLPWDDRCLSFYETDRAVMTASAWQVRQPLYATSVGRWKHYHKHLGPLLRELEGLIQVD